MERSKLAVATEWIGEFRLLQVARQTMRSDWQTNKWFGQREREREFDAEVEKEGWCVLDESKNEGVKYR